MMMNTQAKIVSKQWVRFICFWIVFGLLFTPINLAMGAVSKRWMDFYHLPANSVDVIFIGNSHNYVSFQPQIIDSIIPIRSYVLGVSSENVIISYYELKEILRYQHPKAVVLETFVLDLDDSIEQGLFFDFIDSKGWNNNRTALAARYLTPETSYSIFPAMRTRMQWETPALYLNQLNEKIKAIFSPEEDPQRGAVPNTYVMNEQSYYELKQSPDRKNKLPSPDIQIYLDKFYQLCKENNVKLILTTAPMVKSTPNQAAYYAPYDVAPFVKKNDVNWVVYDPSQFDRLHYANGTHVNMFGADIVSIEMAKNLAQILDLPENESELKYFQSFIFSDYTMENSDDQYVINLLPADRSAPLEYKWTVTNSEQNKVIQESNWTSQSSYQFSISGKGKFLVVVDIRNPAGNYVLSAIFTFTK